MRLRNRRYFFLSLLAIGLVAVLISLSRELRPSPGFTYETYQEICELAYPGGGGQNNIPVVESAALQLSPESYDAWVSGRLFVPDSVDSGSGLHDDFNNDGYSDRMVPVRTDRGLRLIIALGQANGGWQIFGVIDGSDLSDSDIRDEALLRMELGVALNVSKVHGKGRP